jgi:hypothetical protein
MAAKWVPCGFQTVLRDTIVSSEEELAEALGARFDARRQAMQSRLINLGLIAAP